MTENELTLTDSMNRVECDKQDEPRGIFLVESH